MLKVSARKCTVELIEQEIAQSFIKENHLQSSISDFLKTTSVGLFYETELLGVMQFCSPRTSKKKLEYTTELVRLCFKKNVRVVGGASKLFSYFVKTCSPSDIFTYQDTTGESSQVYEHCGMTLVSKVSKQRVLIAPGKTFETASRDDKEVFTIATAAKRGPDALLKTKIGEVGDGVSNIELFTEVLGWTIHETSGYRVYEWVNPNVTFYTYKITASDSDKYYFGMSHVKKSNASDQDCLNDGYYGSGGVHSPNNKFVNWKKKHSKNLVKEILSLHHKRSDALRREKELVGDAWSQDPLCLNSRAGGVFTGIEGYKNTIRSKKECEIHGHTLHKGDACCKCSSLKGVMFEECAIHGVTAHRGECYKCRNLSLITMDKCEIHGDSKYWGANCMKCSNEKSITVKDCPTHGLVTHQGEKCTSCVNESLISVRECASHGETRYRGSTCMKCVTEKTFSERVCDTHGATAFHGDRCVKCLNLSSITLEECSVHGLSKHRGGSCFSCDAEGAVSVRTCPTHGEVKHLGSKCFKCRKPSVIVQVCAVHGETKYQGDKCLKCNAKKRVLKEKECTLCHKSFTPTNSRQKVCSDEHYVPCPLCGEDMLYHSKKKTCSISCGLKLKKKQDEERVEERA